MNERKQSEHQYMLMVKALVRSGKTWDQARREAAQAAPEVYNAWVESIKTQPRK